MILSFSFYIAKEIFGTTAPMLKAVDCWLSLLFVIVTAIPIFSNDHQGHHYRRNNNYKHHQHQRLHGPLHDSSMSNLIEEVTTIGDSVQLECSFANINASNSRLVWTKDARLIRPDGIHYIVHPNGTLNIQHASLADAGWYRCLLTRQPVGLRQTTLSRQIGHHLHRPMPVGRFLNGTKLKVVTNEPKSNHDLYFQLKPPLTISAYLGGSADITCEAATKNITNGVQVIESWSRFNQPITPTNRIHLLDSGRMISITDVRPEDAGDYVCVAASTAGQVIAATSTLLIVPKPPDEIQVVEGSHAEFDCSHTPTSGDREQQGVSMIEWAHGGKIIKRLPLHWRLSDNFAVLKISATDSDDTGLFECSIRNRLNEVIGEYRWRLNVVPGNRPKFLETPTDQLNLDIGSTLEVTCKASGSPAPLVNWVRLGPSGENTLSDDPRVFIAPESGRLEINHLQPSDAGTYSCMAFNELGEISSDFKLSLKPLRPLIGPTFLESRAHSQINFNNVDLSLEVTEPALVNYQKHNKVSGESQNFLGDYSNNSPSTTPFYQQFVAATPSVHRFGDSYDNLDRDHVADVVSKVRQEVQSARSETQRHLHDKDRHKTPQDVQAMLRQPDERASRLSEAAEIYERSLALIEDELLQGTIQYSPDTLGTESIMGTQLLSTDHLQLIANLSGCQAHRHANDINCSGSMACFHAKYRTADGTCNNLKRPTWGASYMPFARLLGPIYENGLNEPVGWNDRVYNGFKLPSAREVSTQLLSANRLSASTKFTHMLMQWGQFVDHDLTFTPMTVSSVAFGTNRRCNDTCENEAPCFPISVSPHDKRIKKHRCIGVTRSAATCGTGSTSLLVNYVYPREQFNQLTSFLDGSAIYGSTDEMQKLLRDQFNTGYLLRVGPKSRFGDQYLLPLAPADEMDCQIDQSRATLPCFLAGDHRANEQLGLLSLHTLFMREHNRIASFLHEVNPNWEPEIVYQEARKIVGGVMQHITYKEWLPKIIGKSGMETLGEYKGYNETIQPDILNEFATAAFRFGHTLIMPAVFRFDENLQPLKAGHLPLHEAFFAPYRIVDDDGGIDAIIRGLFAHAGKHFEPGQGLNKELTERLFALAHDLALDLAALNIQRGRDHAIRGYISYRESCGLGMIRDWTDLKRDVKNQQVLSKLETLYGHPENIDLFTGLLSEDPVEGAIVGPTLTCLLVEQFRRLRDGDRFWYEKTGVFSELQLHQIQRANLARIICDTSDGIDRVQNDVFLLPNSDLEYKQCKDINGVDLNYWRDCCYAEGRCTGKPEMSVIQDILQNQRQVYQRGRSREFSNPSTGFLRTSNHPVKNIKLGVNVNNASVASSEVKVSVIEAPKQSDGTLCCTDESTKQTIANLVSELSQLKRELAEFKARIRFRHQTKKRIYAKAARTKKEKLRQKPIR